MLDIERFLSHVQVGDTPDDCWLWTGYIHPWGYGTFNSGRKTPAGNWQPIQAHRWSYQHYIGHIPTDYVVDHLCEVRACVNPAHLEAVTNAENIARRYRRAHPTHCPNGHPWTPENTYRYAKAARVCRRCHADYEATRRRRALAYREEITA